jgi:hypothetical protein
MGEQYRVVVHYLGHSEGGNATAWASVWAELKDGSIARMEANLARTITGASSHFSLVVPGGKVKYIPTDVLRRSVVVVEDKPVEVDVNLYKTVDGEKQSRLENLLVRYKPFARRSVTGGEFDAAYMLACLEGEYVRLADVRELLDSD